MISGKNLVQYIFKNTIISLKIAFLITQKILLVFQKQGFEKHKLGVLFCDNNVKV